MKYTDFECIGNIHQFALVCSVVQSVIILKDPPPPSLHFSLGDLMDKVYWIFPAVMLLCLISL